MPRLRTLQTNFSSGELDPLMHFRVDTGAYKNGAQTLLNTLIFSSGGVARRMGTEAGSTLVGNVRLEPFEFASDERYVLAFSDGRLDVYDTDAALVTSVTTGCNWTTATLFEFTFAQRADTMIVAHQSWAMQKILRTGATSFTVSDFAFTESIDGKRLFQPYYKFADDDVTISLSATSGAGVTLTCSHSYFTADYVGLRLRWKKAEMTVTGFTSSSELTVELHGTASGGYDNNPFRTTKGSATVVVTHVLHGLPTGSTITIAGSGSTGGIADTNLNGARTITVTDENHYTFTAGAAADESIDGGGPSVTFTGTNLSTRDWDEQVFSDLQGYPGAVAFHQGRLWFGGSSGIPDGLWSSKLFEYFNFDVGDASTADSVQVTIGSDDISNVRHLVSNKDLQVFTATGEFAAKAPRDLALTPGNITIDRHTPYGSALAQPSLFDGATIFLQASGNALREFLYSEASQRYTATNLNVLASHLVSNPYQLAVLYGGNERNEQYAFLVNDDGSIGVFYSARSEELAGWCKWQPGGAGSPAFKSLCVVGEDVFISTYRGSAYYLEKLSDSRSQSLDATTDYTSGTAQNEWTVGSIYYSTTVSVVSNGYYLGDFAVDGSGNLDVVEEVTDITVGYGYTLTIKTLPVDVQLQTGATLGLPKRIARVFVGLDTTSSLSVAGNKLLLRQVATNVEDVPTPITGTSEFRLLGYAKDATVEITQEHPLPATVLGMSMEVQV